MSTFSTCTSSTRPGSPTDGDVLFETDTKNVIIWDGTNWRGYQYDTAFGWTGSSAYSINLDGTDDYVDISSASSLVNSVTAFSISLWYKQDTAGGVLIGSGTANSNGIWLQPYTDGNFYVVIRSGATNTLTATRPALNTWVHTVVTYDAGTIKLYLTPDGGSTNVTTITNGPSTTSSTIGNDLSIGRLAWNTGNPFYLDGKVDEVAIFDTVLTASNVTSIYNSGVPTNLSSFSPNSWWRMGDNNGATGTTLYDQGSDGNNGTLTNGPTYSTDVPS